MDIKLFDKRYVYLEWSDELEGKDCILAKSYKDLKDFVNSGDEGRFCKVNKGREKPFTNGWSECDFCYYDPNLKVKKAWLDGKTIQKRDLLNEWEDYIDTERISLFFYNIKWDAHEWRIKPEYNFDWDNIVDYPNYQPTEPKYYLSVNKNGYLEFTISQNITDNAIYNGSKKECERMVKIIGNEFGDCDIPCYCYDKLYYIIDKYSHEKYKRRMTNRELGEYLTKGNGEMKIDYFSPNALKFISTIYTSYSYLEGTENEEIGSSTFIRDFGSNEWREPLIEV